MEKWEIYSHWKKFRQFNYLVISLYRSKTAVFTKFLPKMCESKFQISVILWLWAVAVWASVGSGTRKPELQKWNPINPNPNFAKKANPIKPELQTRGYPKVLKNCQNALKVQNLAKFAMETYYFWLNYSIFGPINQYLINIHWIIWSFKIT